jgi:hypothetical protein
MRDCKKSSPGVKGSLLPRFFGAYRIGTEDFFVANNVFAEVCSSCGNMAFMDDYPICSCGKLRQPFKNEIIKFDLKGSSWDRKQRRSDSEYLELDLLAKDRKIIPIRDDVMDALIDQLRDDADFLSRVGSGAFAGVMDYSLVIGLIPPSNPEGPGIAVSDKY